MIKVIKDVRFDREIVEFHKNTGKSLGKSKSKVTFGKI
jgi:hypothetical protein